MTRTPKDVTDAELAILKVLWERESASVREITDEVYSSDSDSDYATVKKLLARLEKKKFVSRDREQIAHQFSAIVSRDDLLGIRLQGLADNLCGGSQTPLLMQLLNTEEVNAQQRQQLRDLIQEISESKSASKSQKRGKKSE